MKLFIFVGKVEEYEMNMLIESPRKMNILKGSEVIPLFDVLKASISRSNMELTVVFLKAAAPNVKKEYEREDFEEKITDFLLAKVRNTDLLFKLENNLQWGILLIQNGEEEGNAFLKRLFHLAKNENLLLHNDDCGTLQGSVVEIKDEQVLFEDLIASQSAIFSRESEPWKIDIETRFKAQPIKNVKVSIIEENAIFRDVLEITVQKLIVDYFHIETKVFSDGYEFLQSDWYFSGHTHIVVMNDILPRKNGMEVLHTLRKLANQKKFIIYMMTNRNSQADMVFAYESGVDEYLFKPFDLRLFKAQLQRTFARL
ncbi:response regulator [Lysinibacillus sp. NPDC096418]|uniref:response regulator n=1 Tax=Lysinibacillus sp. NPDC096418 TaxID=3364138 RepID=UPI0038181B82